jgi:choline dehydrogenase-like flavoprotein
VVRYQLGPEDVRRMHRGLIYTARMAWAAGAKTVYPVCAQMPVIERPEDQAKFEALELKAADLQLTSYHPLGTCKMGRDPKASVVDLDHQTHDVEGLYIVDGSTVPGPLGVNPQITIMAMATRAAERIADSM